VNLAALARYPFLPEAGAWVAQEGPSLEDLLAERVYAGARARGRERLLAAIEQGELPATALAEASGPRELLEELLAYVYARILVCAMDDPYVVRRHALAEAVRARGFLAVERDPALLARAAEAVGLAFEPEGAGFRAHFTEYLRYAVHLKDVEWKLVRQPLSRGFVQMDAATASRLVQEALRRRIEAELPKPLAEEVEEAVAGDLAPLLEAARVRKEAIRPEAFGAVQLDLIPPCMANLLAELQQGKNVAHNGRFAITTFLHKIGLSSEDIMKLFAQAPDFREDLTRYQVEHITGVTSSTVYNVPGCDNLQTFSLCYADDLCRTKTKAGMPRVRYPGDYYRYMVEAQAVSGPIAQRVPLDDPKVLTMHLAKSYGLLMRAKEMAESPAFQRVEPEAVLAWVAEAKIPVKVKAGEKGSSIVMEPDDPWQVLRLVEGFLAARPAAKRGP